VAAVDYTNAALLSRVQAWLALPLTQRRSPEGLAQLAVLYSETSGSTAGSCRQCQYSDFNYALVAYERHSLRLLHPDLMAKTQYTLAPGYENTQFVHDSYNGVITAENLTDKAAEFFISKGFSKSFLKNGQPIKEEASAEGTASANTAPKKLKSDYQAEYKALFEEEAEKGLTIEQLKEAIEAKQAEMEANRD